MNENFYSVGKRFSCQICENCTQNTYTLFTRLSKVFSRCESKILKNKLRKGETSTRDLSLRN